MIHESLLAFSELKINKASTKIFIGAPPRSGNTYLRYVLGVAHRGYVEISGGHNVHSAIDRLESTDTDTIFVSPVRDPRDTVISSLVWLALETNGEVTYELTNAALQTVTTYWEILLTEPDKFCIVDFDDLIAKDSTLVSRFHDKYESLAEYNTADSSATDLAYELLNSDDDSNYENDQVLFKARGHLPRGKSEYTDAAEYAVSNIAHKKRLEYLYSMHKQLVDLAI